MVLILFYNYPLLYDYNTFCKSTTYLDKDKCDNIERQKKNLKEEIEQFVDFIKVKNIHELFMFINVYLQPNDKYMINILNSHLKLYFLIKMSLIGKYLKLSPNLCHMKDT